MRLPYLATGLFFAAGAIFPLLFATCSSPLQRQMD